MSAAMLPRELVVVLDDAAVHGATLEVSSSLTALLDERFAAVVPLFPEGVSERVYGRIVADDALLDDLCEALLAHPAVSAAYIKPQSSNACWIADLAALPDDVERTPDYTERQSYLDAAPEGVDARFAWEIAGGDGAGVGIIDVEGGWCFTHEDLAENKGGVVGGKPVNDHEWRNHGTAVLGVFGGDRNAFGVTGICPAAHVRAVSVFGGTGSAGAIVKAAQLSKPGDVILIELHRPGPRAKGGGQQGFIAIEWWPDDYDAIAFATGRGVVVVEAAGNGAEDLDHPAYDAPARGFPRNWKNPFRRGDRDSGAILVGAGAPPPGTHGQNHGPDRSRLDFSNYGAAVDAQGWGREVTTCGYGDLQGGAQENLWYTDSFSGTSSASPIVVGAVGCLQGVLHARGQKPMSSVEARNLLRRAGSPQTDARGRPAKQRIGLRPDLRALIPLLPEPTPPLAPVRPRPEFSEAALRVAAKKLVELTRPALFASIAQRLAPRDSERLTAFFQSEYGAALHALLLSLALSSLASAVPAAGALARELRVSAMAGSAEALLAPLLALLQKSGAFELPARAEG